jgi:hypothetical protein
MRLSVRENFIAVNFTKIHVSGNWSVPVTGVGVVANMTPAMHSSRGDRRALRSLFYLKSNDANLRNVSKTEGRKLMTVYCNTHYINKLHGRLKLVL